jgi:hypothetical protein
MLHANRDGWNWPLTVFGHRSTQLLIEPTIRIVEFFEFGRLVLCQNQIAVSHRLCQYHDLILDLHSVDSFDRYHTRPEMRGIEPEGDSLRFLYTSGFYRAAQLIGVLLLAPISTVRGINHRLQTVRWFIRAKPTTDVVRFRMTSRICESQHE